MKSTSKEKLATAGSEYPRWNRKGKQKISSSPSVISKFAHTENQEVLKNVDNRKERTHIPTTYSSIATPPLPFKNGPTCPEVRGHIGIQSTIQDSSFLGAEADDGSNTMNSEIHEFWERRNISFGTKKHQRKNKPKNSLFHLVTFTASTSAAGEDANIVASNSDPDVVSLSDGEGNHNQETDTESGLTKQTVVVHYWRFVLKIYCRRKKDERRKGGNSIKQLQAVTSASDEKEVRECPSTSGKAVIDAAMKIGDVTILGNERNVPFSEPTANLVISEKESYCEDIERIEKTEINKGTNFTGVSYNSPTARSKKEKEKDTNLCGGKEQSMTKVLSKSSSLVVQKGCFDGFDLIPGMHKFIQNGEMEMRIEKPKGKDFVHLILFECYGPLEDPKQVVRGGYKICTSAVLHVDTSAEVMREAFIGLAEQLERISLDSFSHGEKLPYCVDKYSLRYLEKQFIYPLKKKSSRFTRAIYYCGLCRYHICSVSQAVTHFLSREHVDNKEKINSLKKLERLPRPARNQTLKVDQIIREVWVFTRLADTQYEVGLQIASLLSIFLQKEAHKGYSVMVYGSYLTKLSTLHSNLNLALNFPLEYSLGYALSRVMEVLDDTTLEKDFAVHSIVSDFQRPDPSIRCIINSVEVIITANCLRQQRSTQLVNLYCTIRPQFRILAAVFRSWAELCSLTNIQLGGMPKFAFDVMLIHYLQHRRLLPFVFEILDKEELAMLNSGTLEFEHQVDKINAAFGTDCQEWNFGELWIGLFRYYVVEHPVQELIQIRRRNECFSKDVRWSRKRLAVEDPFVPDYTMQPQQRISSYFSSCFLSTYLHFALPRTSIRSLIPYSVIISETVDAQIRKKRKRRSRKTSLLKDSFDETTPNKDQQNNRSDSDDVDNLCEDLTSLKMGEMEMTTTSTDKQQIAAVAETELENITKLWSDEIEISHPGDKLSCDGAYSFDKLIKEVAVAEAKENCNSTAILSVNTLQQQRSSKMNDDYWENNLNKMKSEDESDENLTVPWKYKNLELSSFDYDASNADLIASRNHLLSLQRDANENFDREQHNAHFLELCSFSSKSVESGEVPATGTNSELSQELKELELPINNRNLSVEEECDEKNEVTEIKLASTSTLNIKFDAYDEMYVRKLWLTLNDNEYDYPWDLHCFTSGLTPILRCTSCNADGHLREGCPELMVAKPRNFPPLTNAQKEMINFIIRDVFEAMRIRPYYVRYMSALRRELEVCLRDFYRADCRLSLFGSAGNGFGLLGSDADICLRFGTGVKPEDIDSVEVIHNVAEVVRKMPNVAFVSEIPHAKVPIVKFRCYNREHLEADVSLYNVLALENTRLLRTYSRLDQRIHQLGIMTKVWAKNCEIGNASKGSLSSYSYIIMLIHYLQRTNPPVAPFLQEVAPRGRCIKPIIVDDCNVYFCRLEDLDWTAQNRSSVGELWMGFLDYFGVKFDFTREVIQIRQMQPLMKLDKGWQSRPIAIEDPFDLSHNLSSGVHSKTMAYIQKSFIHSLEKFHALSLPNPKLDHSAFVFHASLLLESCRVGNGPPLDRNCCHRCRQIGHFVENCPLGMKDKKRNKYH